MAILVTSVALAASECGRPDAEEIFCDGKGPIQFRTRLPSFDYQRRLNPILRSGALAAGKPMRSKE
jgi:hypothetical protein